MMKLPDRIVLPTRRAVALAMGALVLLCILFVLGYPSTSSEHTSYRSELRMLRVASIQLEQDILRTRMGLEPERSSWPGRFIALRAKAAALRDLPAFLHPEERQALSAGLDEYLRLLGEAQALLARIQEEDARAAELRTRFARSAFALAEQLQEAEALGQLEAVTAGVLKGHAPEAVGPVLAALAEAPLAPELVARRAALLDLARQALAHEQAADDALRVMLKYSPSNTAGQLITIYLQHYEEEVKRSTHAHLMLFALCLLLVAFVMVVMMRLGSTGQQLNRLNRELERRVAERTSALTLANEELRDNAARKAAILEGSLDCIITLDDAGCIQEFNPAAEQTFRLAATAALGRDFRRLALSATEPGAQRDAVEHALRPAAEPGRATRMELNALRADGSPFPAELTIFRVRGDGSPRFSIYLRDISERREVERMKNEFISTVSHELRTPLTSIRGSLGLMENGIMGALPLPVLDMVRIARSNTERLIRLINDILDLEKIESGKLELKLQALEVSELIDATFSGLRSVADTAEVTLRSSTAGVGPVRGDRDRIIQVLTNLVSNAVKFSPRKGVVKVSAVRDARGAVRFSVSDQGPGISAEQRKRLFGKFQQLDGSDTRSKGGTGLGLAISQSIIQQHGSRIEVLSEPGHGATFTFVLAAMNMDSASIPVIRDESRHNVLIVTGDDVLFAMLKALLRHEGYRVLRTASAHEAWRMIEAGAPEVLVLDTELTDGSGVELMHRLRAWPRTQQLPILMVSPHPPERGEQSLSMPVDWLVKPFDEARFLSALRSALRQPGQARVLIVDDDPGMREVLTELIENLGVQCYTAPDGDSGVALARERPPDLIILDVNMPRMDGFEVVDMLRQGKSRTTPLIIFTGQELSPEDQRQLTLGSTCYLHKERHAGAELARRVKELLDGLLVTSDGPPELRKAMS